ncbi:MAG: TPM domain-containing protein [Sodalinema sp.]|uniref:TPM domain-containing protein n=1 Tax=Sodalinema sp. TaxID=3080550 RepID=UPI00396F5AC0
MAGPAAASAVVAVALAAAQVAAGVLAAIISEERTVNRFEVKAMWTSLMVAQRFALGGLQKVWQGIQRRRWRWHRPGVKGLMWGLLMSVAMIGFPLVSQALTVQEVPNPQQEYGGWVTDMANVLSEATEQRLDQKISDLEAQNGTEIAVVTVRDTASEATPKDFATELFNHWDVGKADADNGVLWLHSVGDRRVEIETGYGVEGMLPDARVGRMIDQLVIPEFREDDFDAGTLAGVEALITVLSGEEFQLPDDSPQVDALSEFGVGAIVLWGASVLGYGAIRRRLKQPIELDPQGRSRVMGKSDATLYGGVLFGATVCGFMLCLGVVITLLMLDSSRTLAFIAIALLLAVTGVTAIVRIGQFIIRSWRASFEEEGSDRYLGLLSIPLKLFLGGFVFWVGSTIVMVIAGVLFVEVWGDDLGPVLLGSLVAALGMGWVAYTLSRPWLDATLKRVCQTCQTELVPVSESEVTAQLNHHQNVAQDLGSTKFTGLRCPNCCPETSEFHLRSYILKRGEFTACRNCEEFTVTHETKTLVQPTYQSTGLRETTYTCQACDYSKQEQSIIPRLTQSVGVTGGGGGGFDGGGGGGGFGGGDSGGGGAGGSY